MKFSLGALKVVNQVEFCERLSDSYTSCKGISEFSPVLSIFFD